MPRTDWRRLTHRNIKKKKKRNGIFRPTRRCGSRTLEVKESHLLLDDNHLSAAHSPIEIELVTAQKIQFVPVLTIARGFPRRRHTYRNPLQHRSKWITVKIWFFRSVSCARQPILTYKLLVVRPCGLFKVGQPQIVVQNSKKKRQQYRSVSFRRKYQFSPILVDLLTYWIIQF